MGNDEDAGETRPALRLAERCHAEAGFRRREQALAGLECWRRGQGSARQGSAADFFCTPPANQREVARLDYGILKLDLRTTPNLSHTCKSRHEAALKSSRSKFDHSATDA